MLMCFIITIFEKFLTTVMHKIFSFIIVSLLLLSASAAKSQTGNDTILLINGTEIITTVYDTTFGNVTFKNSKPEKDPITIESDDVYSIRNSKGESIIYHYDSAAGNDLTVEEMKYYIKGEQDAQKKFKPRGAFWTNMVVGAASGVTGSFLCPLPPFAFTSLCGLPKVKIKHSTVSNLEYLKHDTYIMGYEKVARGKRKTKSLLGGGIGLVAGLGIVWGILQPNHSALLQ